MLASFSLKIGTFKAKTRVLEVFVCFTNFFGFCFQKNLFDVIVYFVTAWPRPDANFEKWIHAISDTRRSRGTRVTRTEKNIQNIEVTRKLKSFYRVNHYKYSVFKRFLCV